MTGYLIINKGTMEVYNRETMAEVAFIVGAPESEILWQLKRTGRYDKNRVIVVIESLPQEEI